ncbi:efflux RND transporter permease subunit [Primorskyibacter sp. 2E107]
MRTALAVPVRLRFVLFAVLMAAAVLSAVSLPDLEWRLNARELVPEEQTQAASREAEAVFGISDTLTIGVLARGGDVFAPGPLALVRDLSGALQQIPGVAHVRSLATVPQVSIDEGLLHVVPKLAERAPDRTLAETLRRDIVAAGKDNGLLVSRDHGATMIELQMSEDADPEAVIAAVGTTMSVHAAGAELILTGASLAQAELGRALVRDLAAFLPAMGLILGLLLFALYRHALPVLAILLKLALTILLTAGAMAGLGIAVYVPTLILPVVILVIAVSDDIYVIDQSLAQLGEQPAAAWQECIGRALVHAMPAVTFSALTTSGGLLALMLTRLTAYADFALAGAIGILISFLLTVSFLPACLALASRATAQTAQVRRERVRGLMRGLWLRRTERRGLVLGVMGLIAVIGLLAVPKLRINDSWLANLPAGSAVVVADESLSRHVAGTTQLHLLLADRQGGSLLDGTVARRVFEAERRLASAPGVGALVPVHDDIMRLNAALRGEAFHAFDHLRRVEGTAPGELLQGDMIVRTFRRYPLAPRTTADGSQGLVTLYLRAADYHSVGSVLNGAVAAVNASDLGLTLVPFGEAWDGYRAIDLVVDGFPKTLAGALLLTFGLAALLFRSLRAAFLVFLPTLSTILLLLALLAMAGKSLGIATAMFAAIAIGASVDYSIHLLVACRNAQNAGLDRRAAMDAALALTAPATISAALAAFGGLSVLILSSVPPNLDLGLLICASLVLSAALSLSLIPTLSRMQKTERRA